MPTLELAIDATKGQQGAAAFVTATKTIESAAAATQNRLLVLDQAMDQALASTRGLSDATTRLSSTTRAVEASASSAQQKLAMYEKSMAGTFEATKALSDASVRLQQATLATENILSGMNNRLKVLDASMTSTAATSSQMGATYVASSRMMDAAALSTGSRIAATTRAVTATTTSVAGMAGAAGMAAGGMSALGFALPGMNLMMIAPLIAQVVGGLIAMDNAADKAAMKADVFTISLEQVRDASRQAADGVYDMRRALEIGSTKDQSEALRTYISSLEQADKAVMKMRGVNNGLYRTVNANDYRDMFEFNDQAKERFKKLFEETRVVVVDGKEKLVQVLNESAYEDRSKGAVFGVSAIAVQEAFRDVLETVKTEKKKVDDEIKRERNGPGDSYQPKVLDDLQRELELTQRFGSDQAEISRQRDIAKTITQAQSEAERAYGDNMKAQTVYVAAAAIAAIDLADARERVAQKTKDELAAKNNEKAGQTLDAMRDEIRLANQFVGNKDGYIEARQRLREETQALAEAEKLYGANTKQSAEWVKQYMALYDELATSRRNVEPQQNDNRAQRAIDLMKQEIDIANQFVGNKDGYVAARERLREETQALAEAERIYGNDVAKSAAWVRQYMTLYDQLAVARRNIEEPKNRKRDNARDNFEEVVDNLRIEKDTIFMTNKEREIQLKLQQAQRIADLGEVSDKEAKLKQYERELRALQNYKDLQKIAVGIGDSFGSAFEDVIFGAKSASEAIRGFYESVTRMIFNQMVTQPLAQAITGGLSSFMRGFITPTATGGVFMPGGGFMPVPGSSDSLYGFGGNRVGSIAEREPEAVVPLTTGPQGLGIRMYGGGGGGGTNIYNLNIKTKDADSFRRSGKMVRDALRSMGG